MKIGLEILSNFSNQTLKRQLMDQEFVGLLVLADLMNHHNSQSKVMWIFTPSMDGGNLPLSLPLTHSFLLPPKFHLPVLDSLPPCVPWFYENSWWLVESFEGASVGFASKGLSLSPHLPPPSGFCFLLSQHLPKIQVLYKGLIFIKFIPFGHCAYSILRRELHKRSFTIDGLNRDHVNVYC